MTIKQARALYLSRAEQCRKASGIAAYRAATLALDGFALEAERFEIRAERFDAMADDFTNRARKAH